MVNPLEILKVKVHATNRTLKSKKRGVTIEIRKDGFTLRAYLPSKSNPESNQTIQQRVPINLKADIKNLKEAERLAIKLSNQKIAIKIDVEGHELSVLKGFFKLLSNNKCIIQIEIFDKNFIDVDKFLKENKFSKIINVSQNSNYFYSNFS